MCDFEVNGDGVQLISALAQFEYRYKLFSSAKRIMRWRASIKGLVRRYFFVVVSEQSGLCLMHRTKLQLCLVSQHG